MGLRFSCKGVSITAAGTTFQHGLFGPQGTGVASNSSSPYSQAPDEWKCNVVGATAGQTVYRTSSLPTSTGITFAAGSGTVTADIFANINSTFIQ